MASIRERTSATTGTTWQVLYRHGNKQASRTFKDEKKAAKFKGLVELLGPDRALVELFADGKPNRLTVDDLATQFLEWKESGPKKVTPRTLTDYKRDTENCPSRWPTGTCCCTRCTSTAAPGPAAWSSTTPARRPSCHARSRHHRREPPSPSSAPSSTPPHAVARLTPAT
jgi:hypothetical protein